MRHYTLYILLGGLLLSCTANSKEGSQPNSTNEPSAPQRPIEVVVHRGANALAPENTMPSADSALAHGATWIEVDVRTSKDGVMYNLHDETLNRTTDGSGNIGERTSDYIDRLDAGSWYDETRFKGLHVPTIDAMLQGLKGRAKVFFDVKDCNLQELADLARRTGFADSSFFWFGREEMLREFVRIAPEMKIKVNAADTVRLEYWKTICTPSIVEIHADKLTPDFLDYCHRHNIKVMVGAQGESLDDYRTAIETGADMINLDKPELFEKLMLKGE